ncbi:peroxisome assembly protein 26 [Hippocampus comes]|uniref:peroxisome assembly protein 26 n=1 Tax=Hippocampus comes TaxID=109280 RepID=UPI00094E245E|nr:PREDICTED: peroxisome assembly protein 26 [Hippocampus comes]XP_019749245.1 PREDICTED: peroxisome assembly protein 26 [Hippocampus comes]
MSSPTVSGDFMAVFKAPLSSTQSKLLDMLEDATEQLMLYKDFDSSFHVCERGLESLAHAEEEDVRGELKAGFCIVGIQALAELNQWPGVLAWVCQHYEHEEDIPAKILQMCILLYAKVGEPAAVKEATQVWLRNPSNRGLQGFRTVAELYLLHVLLPLELTDQARELVVGELGRATFTEEQQQTALDIIEEEEREKKVLDVTVDCRLRAENASTQGSLLHKVEALLRLTCRRLTSASGFFPFHKLILAALILYMLLLRLDPALPSSFVWISKLHQLLRQMWNVMVAPYYRARKD